MENCMEKEEREEKVNVESSEYVAPESSGTNTKGHQIQPGGEGQAASAAATTSQQFNPSATNATTVPLPQAPQPQAPHPQAPQPQAPQPQAPQPQAPQPQAPQPQAPQAQAPLPANPQVPTTAAAAAAASKARLRCHSCSKLLEYDAGAQYVQCFNCSVMNAVQPNQQLGGRVLSMLCAICHTTNLAPYGINFVRCGNCSTISQVTHAYRGLEATLPVQPDLN